VDVFTIIRMMRFRSYSYFRAVYKVLFLSKLSGAEKGCLVLYCDSV